MKFLLDVNALIACHHPDAQHHARFHAWAKKAGTENLYTCAITELGFIRISMAHFSCTLSDAENALKRIRNAIGGFISDAPSPALAAWATTAGKTTDAYLCQLASANKMKLATLDTGIKDQAAFLLP